MRLFLDTASIEECRAAAKLRHPLTDVGIERFLADAQKAMKTERV